MAKAAKPAEPSGAALQVRKIGNSVGIILPKDLLARLDLKAGDRLHVVEAADRALKLSPYDPAHAKALAVARNSFRTYANTYKALAK